MFHHKSAGLLEECKSSGWNYQLKKSLDLKGRLCESNFQTKFPTLIELLFMKRQYFSKIAHVYAYPAAIIQWSTDALLS